MFLKLECIITHMPVLVFILFRSDVNCRKYFSNNFYICVLSVFSITSILVGDFISRQHQYDKDYLHHLYGDI